MRQSYEKKYKVQSIKYKVFCAKCIKVIPPSDVAEGYLRVLHSAAAHGHCTDDGGDTGKYGVDYNAPLLRIAVVHNCEL